MGDQSQIWKKKTFGTFGQIDGQMDKKKPQKNITFLVEEH